LSPPSSPTHENNLKKSESTNHPDGFTRSHAVVWLDTCEIDEDVGPLRDTVSHADRDINKHLNNT